MGEKSRVEKYKNRLPDYTTKLRTMGEIGIVHKSCKSAKYEDKGFASMLIGYSDQHPKGTYRTLNI